MAQAAPVDDLLFREAPIDEVIYDEAPVDEAAPQETTTSMPILWQRQQGPNSDGSYNWAYEGANGVKAEEKGTLKEVGTGADAKKIIVVEGKFSYNNQDGSRVELTYVADENGFRAMGAHLPTPPPMPPAIYRSLEWVKTHSTTAAPTTTESTDPTQE